MDQAEQRELTPVVEIDRLIDAEVDQVRSMLRAKNRDYGNSALDPLRIFSKADISEGLRVRIDDKLSRIARGKEAGEDVVLDLIGYFVLLRISERTREEPFDALA